MRSMVLSATAFGLLAIAARPGPAFAQHEIVQPLPPPGAATLKEALSRLARNSADVGALLDAGKSALELGDIDAAIGFFGRANELSAGNSRVKLGLARAYVRSRRPIEALRLFAEAERAGIANLQMAEDRGLAFDLVGDATSAQQLYRLAIAHGAGAEIVRRLALSQAISGNRQAFEATLLPLLEAGDLAAFRTRAFGLAILGDAKAAKAIAESALPRGMGDRMAAYLDYMPRLTEAQQAAAGNLGIFPRAANIGTDDAEIAGYAGGSAPSVMATGTQSEPSAPSAALARQAQLPDPRERQKRRRPDRTRSRDDVAPPPPPPPPPSPPAAVPAPSLATTITEQGSRPPIASTEPAPALPSVADAFSGFTLPPADPAPASRGAVDITRIEIPREKEAAKPPPPPPPPPSPSRHWVQVATGKDTKALGFDWRRIARKAGGLLDGKGPFVTPWGEANRLLSGPYDSATKAKEMVKELKELGLDSFTFTSAVGEEIEELD